MSNINQLKEQAVTDTPLVLFDFTLSSGSVERWSTHTVDYNGQHYDARVLRHDLFELQAGSGDGIDAIARASVWLANADSHCSEVERSYGWKGSQVTIRFLFYDLVQGTATSEAAVLFKGIADAPVETTESTLRLSLSNSLNLQRALLPDVRIERRCPWNFPASADQRAEAALGGSKGKYSPFYRCGYSADVSGGCGNLNSRAPYTTCDRSRMQCTARGMFSTDSGGRATRRFGAFEFVPPTTVVRSYGEKGTHVSQPVANEARYNDFVPLVYGTVWYSPLIVFSKNDGNLTRMDVLLGMGRMESVTKVLVEGYEIPLGVSGQNMTATGWFNIVSLGDRTGAFNAEYIDSTGKPLGDPYGSMAVLNVVVPNRINDGKSLPDIQVLVEGIQLEQFSAAGVSLGESFSKNPAWVLLDLLRRSGWKLEDIDVASFASAAAYSDQLITGHDANGNVVDIPRFQCNAAIVKRRTAADVIRGIRNSSRMLLSYGVTGLLELRVEDTLAVQQPQKPGGSNAMSDLDGGWPAYEFGDGTDGLSGILRNGSGEASILVTSASTAETPNRMTLEFQDSFNEYQQDSLSVVDVDDTLKVGQEVSLSVPALGIPNFNQAARILRFWLDKSIAGNTYVEFDTTVRAVGLKPGDLITVTYLKEGLYRQPFRITKIAPGMNYRTAHIRAQIHDDAWYADSNADPFANSLSGRQQGYGIGLPRPVAGSVLDENGTPQLGIVEKDGANSDGTTRIDLSVDFSKPPQPAAAGPGIPIVSLAAHTDSAGGTLTGDQTLYYALTAGDGSGQESNLSFVVRATIPAGTNTNAVTLSGLSLSSDATCFQVYRGTNPSELLRIAKGRPITPTFTDAGLTTELTPPPDANYDHANIYWRLELQPEYAATIVSQNSIGNDSLGMAPNVYRGQTVRITEGTGAGQERTAIGNTATTVTLSSAWSVLPDSTSSFVVADPGWHFGAAGTCGPLMIEVPNRIGATVHISARAANVNDYECAYELSPLTRWRIGGSATGQDTDVPGKPIFGLATTHRGDISLATVAFEELANTRTISSGTLTVRYWNELSSPSQIRLASAIGKDDASIHLSTAGTASEGSFVQIDLEVLQITKVDENGTTYEVIRAADGSDAASHDAQAAIYHLSECVMMVPFAKDFFGSPSSGEFSYATLLPDARVACAEFFVANNFGNSKTSTACLTGTTDNGMRTLSGGQYSIQVSGHLAVETGAAPPLVIQNTHAVRDIFAVVAEAPTAGQSVKPTDPPPSVKMDVLVNNTVYCSLEIAAGQTYSSAVSGFGLAPLPQDALVTLNITAVPQTADAKPGRDLTVTIRL